MSGYIQLETTPRTPIAQSLSLSRRNFLKTASCAALASSMGVLPMFAGSTQKNPAGFALAYGDGVLDLINLSTGQLVHSFTGLKATHAITPVEALNRFVVHGHRLGSDVGAVLVIEVEQGTGKWRVVLDQNLPGGPALHWQPTPDHREIVFNTIHDGGLHILDTKSLKITRYEGGGDHSTMAFFDDYLLATDRWFGPTSLRIIDRKTGRVEAETRVGIGGHGMTVCRESGKAFVWAWEGLHVVSLAKKSLGKHLKVIPTDGTDERCWFCWTPQGGRYSHDVAWKPSDNYNPYLLVADMKRDRFERITTGEKTLLPSFLQLSPDGRWGLSSIAGSRDVALFDTVRNQFMGMITAGPAIPDFYERDMAFYRRRDLAIVTNTQDQSLSVLNLAERQEIARIPLARRPRWMKVLTPA